MIGAPRAVLEGAQRAFRPRGPPSGCYTCPIGRPLASPLLAISSLTGIPRKLRWALLRLSGVRTEAWNIGPRCYFGTNNVVIGRGTFVNRGCVFDGLSQIRIGERCALGMEVMLVTSTHPIATHERRAGDLDGLPLTIGDGCWIGARAVILPGVHVGNGAVIAAGAVVVSDCDPDTVYAGVPARPVRALD